MLPASFIFLTLATLLLFYLTTSGNRCALIFPFAWLFLVGIPAYYGFFESTNSFPPRFIIIFAGIIIMIFYLYKRLKQVRFNLHYALLIHALRLPVEIGLEQLYQKGLIPQLMTYHGWNFDILIGITAILLWILYMLNKIQLNSKLLVAWNIAGMITLCNIVTLAILSSPLPIQLLAFNQPNIAVLQFPYIFLPACIVPIVFLTHLLTIRQIKRQLHLQLVHS